MNSHWQKFRSKYLVISIIISFVITCFISILPFGTGIASIRISISKIKTRLSSSSTCLHRYTFEYNFTENFAHQCPNDAFASEYDRQYDCRCQECKCQNEGSNLKRIVSSHASRRAKKFHHRLAVLVPFRDRFEELLSFGPHMKQFLDKQSIDYHIFILHQVDKYRFNRASLFNVGFIHIKNEFDYIAMHDVDLLPMNDNLSYQFPNSGPYHISSPDLHPRYHYSTFIGGILLVNSDHFTMVNGMSNKYWGWGLEDDEFYVRLKEANLKVYRPKNIMTGTHNTFKHIHDKNHRKRDMAKCFNQREVTRKRDRQTGMNNVSYDIEKIINITISDVPMTILNIALVCDKSVTPWCECTKANEVIYQGIKERKQTVGDETQGRAMELGKKFNA